MSNTRLPTLGDRVKDPISGFQGIVTAHITYLYGCQRLGVVAEALDGGKVVPEQFFDQAQLKIVDELAHSGLPPDGAAPPGGPSDRERGNFRR